MAPRDRLPGGRWWWGLAAAGVLLCAAAGGARASQMHTPLQENGVWLSAARGRVASTSARVCGSETDSPVTLRVPLHGTGETAYEITLGNLTVARHADCVLIEARDPGDTSLHMQSMGYADLLTPALLLKVTGGGSGRHAWARVAASVHAAVDDADWVTLPHAHDVSVLVQHQNTRGRVTPVPLRHADAVARRVDGRRFVEFTQQPLHTRTRLQLAHMPDPNLYRTLQETRTMFTGARALLALAVALAAAAVALSAITLVVVLRRLPAAAGAAAGAGGSGAFSFGAARKDR